MAANDAEPDDDNDVEPSPTIAEAGSIGIKPTPNGPLVVTGVDRLTDSKGEALPTRPRMELCRCGGSNTKPFCDGTHARRGFSDQRGAGGEPDRVDAFAGAEITVQFNPRQCSGAGECARGLPSVFRHGDLVRIALGRPWVQPDRADADRIVEVIGRCPSGALRYTLGGQPGPNHESAPAIRIRKNGPYEVSGSIPLATSFWPEGADQQVYALCRCGASKNKPFCDGSHRRAGFRDDNN